MNYKKIYNSIISRAKNRDKPSCYCEVHHITPRSMGGTDSRENLVVLTAREHFISHWLLKKIHRNKQMTYAFHCMTKSVGNGRVRYVSHSYKYAKQAMSKWMTENNSGENNPMFGLTGTKNPHFGMKRSKEAVRNISNAAKERYKSNPHPTCRRIYCVDTGEVFESIRKAREKNGGNISYALKTGSTAFGLRYCYVGQEHKIKLTGYATGDRHPNTKRIKDQFGNIYKTRGEAGKSVGVTGAAIGYAIKGSRPCKGVMFYYV